MKLILDVGYSQNSAKTVGGTFINWEDAKLKSISSKIMGNVNEYESGKFYKRELPCIIDFLSEVDLKIIDTIIIDGFVYLNDEYEKGLGYYLFEHLNKLIPIVGVAKSNYYKNEKNTIKILRGNSKRPLFISAVGMDLVIAADSIHHMHGTHRIPNLIKEVDINTKWTE